MLPRLFTFVLVILLAFVIACSPRASTSPTTAAPIFSPLPAAQSPTPAKQPTKRPTRTPKPTVVPTIAPTTDSDELPPECTPLSLGKIAEDGKEVLRSEYHLLSKNGYQLQNGERIFIVHNLMQRRIEAYLQEKNKTTVRLIDVIPVVDQDDGMGGFTSRNPRWVLGPFYFYVCAQLVYFNDAHIPSEVGRVLNAEMTPFPTPIPPPSPTPQNASVFVLLKKP